MKENKYDDNIFFQKYSQMSRSQKGLAGAGEWETLKKMLPDFKGKRVLDLGCGYGWHCIYAMENGASSVVGVDISHKMLEVAKGKTHFPQIEYECCAIEDVDFPEESFDVILSSLAFHYVAIIQERPCAAACGVDAIHTDENGKADIDYDKCVSCGMCLVNCPFGAISDKSQIFQVIRAIQAGEKVYAAVAPAFVGQFGPKVTPGKLRAAMKALGFTDVLEVAIGADLCATQEAIDFVNEVPDKIPFMGTSCCPAWSVMAKKMFPEYANCISMALTPMTLTARLIKNRNKDAKVVFIGPCAAKKLEAMRKDIRSDVDFVLTFEEMAGIFDAKHVDIENIEEDPEGVNDASTDGRNFAVAGGVAKSVVDVIHQRFPDKEIKVVNAEGLRECRKMMTMAKTGKYNGYLLEGMACPGGCVAGAGTMQPIKKSQAAVNLYASKAKHKTSNETEHVKELDKLVD